MYKCEVNGKDRWIKTSIPIGIEFEEINIIQHSPNGVDIKASIKDTKKILLEIEKFDINIFDMSYTKLKTIKNVEFCISEGLVKILKATNIERS